MNAISKEREARVSAAASAFSVTYSYSPSPGAVGGFGDFTSSRSTTSADGDSLFLRQGDYWTIRFRGQLAFLRTSRGLDCLALLLRHPGREFHVIELAGQLIGRAPVSGRSALITHGWQGGLLSDVGPVLDAQAKTQYKHRWEDLRRDLEEAERDENPIRAERARNEIDALAKQLASAVGFGGQDRRIGSATERARSAVTKRIKNAINRIGADSPSLRRHLAARIKTGYFCSYNPHPEHPVVWKV